MTTRMLGRRPAQQQARAESPHVFITHQTNFAAYLTATGRLHFLGARPGAGGHAQVDLAFDDAKGEGPSLLAAFMAGKADPTEPRSLFETAFFMRGEVKRILREIESSNGRPAVR